jgi:trimeric autotransporter adhesin
VSITPPANLNDSDSSTQSMTFAATIATYHNGTFYSGNTLNYSEHILPVTDDMTITINASNTDEDVSTDFTITLSNDADTVTEIIGGKLYIKVTENYEAGETDLGSLEYNGSTITTQNNPDGLVGNYYVIDISSYTMGNALDFTFNPGNNRHGSVTIEAVVKNKEGHGWDTGIHDTSVQTSTSSTSITVNPVIDGFDAQDVSDSIGVEATGSDLNRIKLDINATLSDPSESIGSATLDKVPNGFLIYFGPDADTLSLATNTGTSGSDTFVINPNGDNVAVSYNQWLIPLTSGQLPAHIWIQAPQNWSGTLDDVVLNLFGLSDGGATTNESHNFSVTFTPVADGVTIDPTLTFGKVYDWVDLKLNANMADVDGSETMSLEISGLNQSAVFRLNDGTLIDATYADNKWSLENISYDEINNIQFAHNDSVGSVTVKAWTVDGADISASVEDTFTLTLSSNGTVVGTTGDDMLVYNPNASLIDGREGNDSLVLLGGAGLDFDASVATISNIEKIDLGVSGTNSITNLKLSDVVSMTDSDNLLVIDGDSSDSVAFKTPNDWTKGASDGTYTTYTNSNDNSVTLKIDNDIQQSL